MKISSPVKYISFLAYCKKRKVLSNEYLRTKRALLHGDLLPMEYIKKLRHIQQAVIELEIKYFDVVRMRL